MYTERGLCMAMVPCTVHAAVGAAGFLASSALPAAFHGSKVWSRAYTQVLSSHHREPEAGPTNKSNSTWAFSPAARELVREAGGFDGGRHWPLGSSTSLLSHRGQLHFTNPHNHLFWHYSIAPKHAEASLASQSLHTAALELQKQEQTVVEQKFPVSHSWYDKVFPRVKGFSRKHALRQFNRRIVPQIARRLTIGIPVVGFYFVSKLMVKDLARTRSEYAAGNVAEASLFATALGADALDLAAQFTVISGLAHAHLGVGLATAAAMLVQADQASLILAALSFSCGLGGELLSIAKGGRYQEQHLTH